MSNFSASNFAIGGTCAISGTVSLSQPLISGSSLNVQGVVTTDLTSSGNVLFNVLPISNALPTLPNQLITKTYVDGVSLVQSTAIAVLQGRADTNDALNLVQDSRILGCETINTNQATSITNINTLDTAQNTRLTAIELVNTNQATSITNINTLDTAQNTRLTAIELVNTNQATSITNINTLDTTQNNRLTAIETVNTNQATSITNINTLDTAQNTRITAAETSITNINTLDTTQNTRITAAETSITNINTLDTAQNTRITATETSITNINTLNLAQDNRLLAVENINTNQSTALTNINVLNTTQNNRLTAVENINTTQGTSITNIDALNITQNNRLTAVENINTTQGTSITNIDALNITQNSRITACENINTSQATSITGLQQKTTPMVYTTPVAGALTSLTSSLDILPYVSSTFLKVYNINNQAISCLGQAIFSGLGLITTRLQLTNFGTIMTGLCFGNTVGVVGNNVVNFPASSFSGFIIPRVLISPSGNGVFFVVSRTLTSFTYSASVGGVNVDWIALQSV